MLWQSFLKNPGECETTEMVTVYADSRQLPEGSPGGSPDEHFQTSCIMSCIFPPAPHSSQLPKNHSS